MASIDSVATSISGAITGANNNVTTALGMLSGQFLGGPSFNIQATAVPALTQVVRNSSIVTSLTAMETILTNLRSDLNSIAEDVAVITSIPEYDGSETAIWSETFWTNLKTTLGNLMSVTSNSSIDEVIADLTSNSTAVGNALYAQDLERKQQALRDAHSAAASATGARGFSYPNSMTTAMKLAATQQYMFDRNQAARDLMKQIFDWAKTSEQFVIGKQIEAHAADAEFNLQYRRMAEAAFTNEAQRIFNKYQKEVELKLLAVDKAITAYRLAYETIVHEDDLANIAMDRQLKAYPIAVQEALTINQSLIRTTSDIYIKKIEAAKDALSASASVASAGSNIIVGVLNQ